MIPVADSPQPREEEEPFSEGFWAGRMSDRLRPTRAERERAYQAYRAGERYNKNDGDRRPLQERRSQRCEDEQRHAALVAALKVLVVQWLDRTGPRWPSEGPAYQRCAGELANLLREPGGRTPIAPEETP